MSLHVHARPMLVSAALYVLVALCALVTTSVILHAGETSRYRAHVLGSSLADVVAQTSARPADVTTVHERPALLQVLEWHRPYSSQGPADDPVKTITFAFIDGQLFQMTVDYDRTRVEGLTTADLIAGVEAVYGTRLPASSRAAVPPGSVPGTVVLGHWADAQASVTLARGPYEDLRLVVRSVALGEAASRATAAAVVQDAADAPARRAASLAAERTALEVQRARNRSAFTP